MQSTQRRLWSGWRLTGVIGAGLIATSVFAYLVAPDPVAGARLVIRLTARTSLALFLLAFAASALVRLFPSSSMRWLRGNRRYIGVAFAISHIVHLAAIIALARMDYAIFLQLTNIVAYVGGGLAYVFIVLMTATSFDRTVAWIGPRAWHRLHTTGMWYIWLSFALNFGKRVPVSTGYLVPVAFIGLAAIIRLLARYRSVERQDLTAATRSRTMHPL